MFEFQAFEESSHVTEVVVGGFRIYATKHNFDRAGLRRLKVRRIYFFIKSRIILLLFRRKPTLMQ